MATYYGDYYSDLGRIFSQVKLSSYWVATTVNTRGAREISNQTEDRDWIPPLWLANNPPVQPRAAYCEPPQRMRYALIWINATRYLHVDLPFLPSSPLSDEFFLQLTNNKKVFSVGLEGELIPPQWLARYA